MLGQSELMTHSGWQFGGFPIYPARQEQDGMPPCSWQIECGPQGLGTHGLTGGCGISCGSANINKEK